MTICLQQPHTTLGEETDSLVGTPEAHKHKQPLKKGLKSEGYRRKIPLPQSEQEQASRVLYLREMKAHFNEVIL